MTWRRVDYDQPWAAFDARFEFKAEYNEPISPATRLPELSLVVDLEPVFTTDGPRFAARCDAINAAALRAFVWLGDR